MAQQQLIHARNGPQRTVGDHARPSRVRVAPTARPVQRHAPAALPTTTTTAQLEVISASAAGGGAHAGARRPKLDRSVLTPVVPLGKDLTVYPCMSGKNVLVTGAARGIGFNTARLLAGLGATVYLADMDEAGLQQACKEIREQVPGSHVIATPRLDLGNTDHVHEWCDAWHAGRMQPPSSSSSSVSRAGNSTSAGNAPQVQHQQHQGAVAGGGGTPKLHVLVNNAGANFMGVEPWYTKQGVAGLPQVNFVGPYTLTRRLMPSLRAAGHGARIVNVASVMHRFSELPHDPEFFLKDWWKGGAYRNCKHANVVFTRLLHHAAEQATMEDGAPMLVTAAVDPGAVYSNIWATSRVFGRGPGSAVIKALFSTPQDACATSVHAAAGPDVPSGQYWARGLFAHGTIVKSSWEPAAGALSCLDWPLRKATKGRVAARVKAVDIAPRALAAVEDGRGVALWDAAAKLAGLTPWSEGLDSL